MEEKGDVEGILRELITGSGGAGSTDIIASNKAATGAGGSDSNAKATIISGLHPQQVETWCADFREAKKSETAMNEQRMVRKSILQYY